MIYSLVEAEFKGGQKGQVLLLNAQAIRETYQYLGLWYARDGSDKTFITTELYFSNAEEPIKPLDFSEEIKENAFKQAKRLHIPLKNRWIWIATRVDGENYCGLKTDSPTKGHLYVNYKTIKNKSSGFDLLDKGMFKGGEADFFKLGIEDFKDKEDYTDTIMYVVMAKNLPPADWKLDHLCLGVQNVPVMVSTALFPADRTYTNWLGQNPLSNINK
jgi:hypothetical protein